MARINARGEQGREATEPVGANIHHQPAYGVAHMSNETAARQVESRSFIAGRTSRPARCGSRACVAENYDTPSGNSTTHFVARRRGPRRERLRYGHEPFARRGQPTADQPLPRSSVHQAWWPRPMCTTTNTTTKKRHSSSSRVRGDSGVGASVQPACARRLRSQHQRARRPRAPGGAARTWRVGAIGMAPVRTPTPTPTLGPQ